MKKVATVVALHANRVLRKIMSTIFITVKTLIIELFFPAVLTIISLFSILLASKDLSMCEFIPFWRSAIIICAFGYFLSKHNKKKYAGAAFFVFAWGISCYIYSIIGESIDQIYVTLPILKMIAIIFSASVAVVALFELYLQVPVLPRKLNLKRLF